MRCHPGSRGRHTAKEEGVEPRGINGVAEADPSRVALVAGDRRVTYQELDAWANQVARSLQKIGVGHGDRVAVMLHNIPELFGVWNGAARLGALIVPLSYRAVTPEVAYIVADSGATAFIYDDNETSVTASGSSCGPSRKERRRPALHLRSTTWGCRTSP